jgi:hypothetical protein
LLVTGLKDSVLVQVFQIQVARCIAPQVYSHQQRHPRTDALNVGEVRPNNTPVFTLLNQPIAKIRSQLQRIVAVEPGKGQLSLLAQCPVVRRNQNDIVCGVRLPIINRVALNGFMNRN